MGGSKSGPKHAYVIFEWYLIVAVTCPKGFLATTLYRPASDGAAGFKVKIEWPSLVLTMLSLFRKKRNAVHAQWS